jgi:hypothetical protein
VDSIREDQYVKELLERKALATERVEILKGKEAIVCHSCVKNFGMMKEYDQSDQAVFRGMGSESSCCLCGVEYGERVFKIPTKNTCGSKYIQIKPVERDYSGLNQR